MKMTAMEAYRTYQSVKLHFTRKNFDFFKSRVKISEKAFMAKRDRFVYYRLAKKYDQDAFLCLVVSNMLNNDSVWSMNLLEPEAEEMMLKHQKRLQSITYNFKEDLRKIKDWSLENEKPIDDILNPMDSYPPLMVMAMQNDIAFETLVIMNEIMNIVPVWNKKINDEVIWPKFAHKCEKYAPFVLPRVDLKEMKKLLKSELCS